MSVSVRSFLTAGVAAAAASVIAIPQSVPTPMAAPTPQANSHLAPRINLTASVTPFAVSPLTAEQVTTANAAIRRIDPTARQLPVPVAAVNGPAPLNAASDWITSTYQFIQYWVDYGVNLADYVLGFIPGLNLIGDQISIVYFNLVRPIADSVVYGLINPVVNDPLNPAVWVNGFINVGQTSVNALVNTGIAEFNYFLGWLIPPLPPLPLPPLPFAAATPTATMLRTTAVDFLKAVGLEPKAGLLKTAETEPTVTAAEQITAAVHTATARLTPKPATVEAPATVETPAAEVTSAAGTEASVTDEPVANPDPGTSTTGRAPTGNVRSGIQSVRALTTTIKQNLKQKSTKADDGAGGADTTNVTGQKDTSSKDSTQKHRAGPKSQKAGSRAKG